MKQIISLLLLIFIVSCETQESATKGVGYFDIEAYINQLPKTLTVQNEIVKTVKLNGKEEKKTIKNYDITPELNMMNKYNINKPALAGKYSEEANGNLIVYTALEDDLIARKLTVEKDGEEVVNIEIEGMQKSILSESKQTLIFAPEKSFLLKSEDKNRFTKDITKEVLIEY